MALGGGTFASQNKILAGTYINFVSASKATATVGDRGYAAMALELDWGPEGTIIEIHMEYPDGRTLNSNMRVSASDIELIESLKSLAKK